MNNTPRRSREVNISTPAFIALLLVAFVADYWWAVLIGLYIIFH